MDVLDRVREIGADTQTGKDEIAVAREALRNEVRRAKRGRRGVGRRTKIGIGGAIGAGVLAAGIVAANALGTLPQSVVPQEQASAAELLEKAAEATLDESLLVPAPGEYLRVRSDTDVLHLWDEDMPDGAHFNNGNPADAEAAWVSRDATSLYVPADRSDDWIRVLERGDIVAQYGDTETALPEFELQRPDQSHESVFLVAPGGAYNGPGAQGEEERTYYLDSRAEWENMPRDPDEYLVYARERVGESAESDASDSSIVENLETSLSEVSAPAELRATWWRVLAMLDGSTVVSNEDGVATILFSWSTEWWTAERTFEVDTTRGLLLSASTSTVRTGDEPSIAGLPGWGYRSTYSYEVVDSAPEPTE